MPETVKELFNRVYKYAGMGAGFDSRVMWAVDGEEVEVLAITYSKTDDVFFINFKFKRKKDHG